MFKMKLKCSRFNLENTAIEEYECHSIDALLIELEILDFH